MLSEICCLTFPSTAFSEGGKQKKACYYNGKKNNYSSGGHTLKIKNTEGVKTPSVK